MDPVTLLAVGSALSAGSQIFGGISAKKQADKQAKLMQEKAAETRARGEINAKARVDKGQQERGNISSGIASAGLSREDSIDTLNYSLANEFEAVQNIRREASWDARMTELEAENVRASGKSQQIAGILGGAGTAIKGYSDYQSSAPQSGGDAFGIYKD
jgi:hypothetical protein